MSDPDYSIASKIQAGQPATSLPDMLKSMKDTKSTIDTMKTLANARQGGGFAFSPNTSD